MRVAIYARVSTDDKGQDPENQLRGAAGLVRQLPGIRLAGNTWITRAVGKARKSGNNSRLCLTTRPSGSLIALLFWALDRFSREGMAQTIIHLQRLSSYGVGFHSYTEAHLATDNELVRNVLLALLSSLAKVEAQKIGERTKAGMARAKAKGIKIGRPRLGVELRRQIAQRAAKGETAYGIAKALGLDRHTAAKYMQT